MKAIKTRRGIRQSAIMGLVSVLVLFTAGLWAEDPDGNKNIRAEASSLARQLASQAREMESEGITEAIEMLLSREGEVLRLSTAAELAHFYNKLAELHATLGRIDKVRGYAEKGLSLYDNDSDPVVAELYYHLGLSYDMEAEYGSARNYYDKGVVIAQKSGDHLAQGRGQLYIAGLYIQTRNYPLALTYMQEAYVVAEAVNDDDFSWEVLNQMGILYGYLGDNVQSIAFHREALETAQRLNIIELTISTLYNLAGTYLSMEDSDNANVYFEQMLTASRQSKEESNMYLAYKGFALSSQLEKQQERALGYINKAEEYLSYIEDVMFRAEHYITKADILSKLGQTSKALEVLSIAEKTLPKQQLDSGTRFGLAILKHKSRFYAELGQYGDAYALLKEYSDSYEEFRNRERDDAVSTLKVTLDAERGEARNSTLEKDNQIKALQLKQSESEQHIQIFFLAALLLFSLILIFVMYRQFSAHRHIKVISETDGLTGLFNRRYALAKGAALLQSGGKSQVLSLILFDLDNFKAINDTYGHSAGDLVLKGISETGRSCLRDSDIMARTGGEEFMVILPGVGLDVAAQIATRLQQKLAEQTQKFEQNHFYISASFGVAMHHHPAEFGELLQCADKALAQAKENGRDCVVVAPDSGSDHSEQKPE